MAIFTKQPTPKRRRGQRVPQPELHGPDETDIIAPGRGAFGAVALLLTTLGIAEGRVTIPPEPTPVVRVDTDLDSDRGGRLPLTADTATILAALSLIAQLLSWWFPRTPRTAPVVADLQQNVDVLIDDVASPLVRSSTPREVLLQLEAALQKLRHSVEYQVAMRDQRAVVDQAILITQDLRKHFARRKSASVSDVAELLRTRLPR